MSVICRVSCVELLVCLNGLVCVFSRLVEILLGSGCNVIFIALVMVWS